MNNSFKMNAYNFKQVDKSNVSTNTNLTKQMRTSPNLLKMFFNSRDCEFDTIVTLDASGNNVVSITNSSCKYNIPTSLFHKFDPDRPVYIVLEFLHNNSTTLPPDLYNLVWNNMPCSNSVWTSNNQNNRNILGCFRGNGSKDSLNIQMMPYVLDTNQLLNTSYWQFLFLKQNNTLLDSTNTSSFMFCLCFYQDD